MFALGVIGSALSVVGLVLGMTGVVMIRSRGRREPWWIWISIVCSLVSMPMNVYTVLRHWP